MNRPELNPRNDGIDLLRGVSIVLVVMHHLAIRIPLTHTMLADVVSDRLLQGLCFNGYESVFAFFVISGFLIAGNARRRWDNMGRPRFRAFYARRFARIVPCLLVLVVLLSALDAATLRDYTILRADQSLPRAVLAALGLHLNWYEGHTGYLPGGWDVLWSLSIEEVFYIGFPIACLLARRSLVPLVIFLTLLAASLPVTRGALASNEIWQEKAYLPGMAAIAVGVLAALCVRPTRPARATVLWLTIGGGAAYASVLLFEEMIWPVLGESTMLLLTVGVAALLLGLQWLTLPRWALAASAWLRGFGRLSYEVYLSHMFVVFSAVALFRWSGTSVRWGFVLYPLVLAAALATGWVVARVISRPAEAWLSRRGRQVVHGIYKTPAMSFRTEGERR